MNPNFQKGLVPAIIQDNNTLEVLMLGYMNEEAFNLTVATNRVTFFSRSKNRLWTKGEESGNYLEVQSLQLDCDNDTILIRVHPVGPTCHTGQQSCFGLSDERGYIYQLEEVISERLNNGGEQSYTAQLYKKGINKVAQKVGEEAVELVIEAISNDNYLFKEEAADLLFHFIVLINAKGESLLEIEKVLYERSSSRAATNKS
jgi:phosphoribosyl-ATP pyrophosphohydrolase/phosphoribosyl-AMP cyclohydrolase